MLNNSFQQTYSVGQKIFIEESMIPWRADENFGSTYQVRVKNI